ncbi:MAG: GreA/GreB family elongation factor [Myxococcota bacterium]
MGSIVAAVIGKLEEELRAVERRALNAAEGATHEESRPEDPKDTRGLETSYLAHGLAQRARALESDIDTLRFLNVGPFNATTPVTTGAKLELEDEDGEVSHFVLLPCAGGTAVVVEGVTVRILSPQSPLGGALLERREGDDVEVRIAGKLRSYVIVSVR